MLRIESVTKHYKRKKNALCDISVQLPETGIVALMGTNGAGKSTLIRLLTTLDKPSSGRIMFNERDILQEPTALRRHLGYLPQHFAAYETLTGLEFLRYVSALKGISTSAIQSAIERAFAMTGLTEEAQKRIGAYSGGMKQRLGIAQAIIGAPKVIVFDEPTTGLDTKERERFGTLLSEMSSTTLVLISTHILSDVEELADKVIFLENGMLKAFGTSALVLPQMLL